MEPQPIIDYVDAIEAVRGPDLSFNPDAEPALPVEATENFVHFLLVSASIDAGVDSVHIRRLLADLSGRLRADERPRGLFDVTPDDAQVIDETIVRRQRHRELGGYRARPHVPRFRG